MEKINLKLVGIISLLSFLLLALYSQYNQREIAKQDIARQEREYAEIAELVAQIPSVGTQISAQRGQTQDLFFLITKLTDKTKLSRHLSNIQPLGAQKDGQENRIGLSLNNLYLNQLTAWTNELAKYDTIMIEQMNVRTKQDANVKKLDVSLILKNFL